MKIKRSLTSIFLTFALLFVSLAGVGLTPGAAQAVTSAQKQAEANAARSQLETIAAKLDAASDVYFGAVAQVEAAQAQMDEAQAKIDEATTQIADRQVRISTRAKAMYKTGTSSIIDVLLDATTFQEFSTTWDILQQINASDAELIGSTKALRAELETQKEAYQQAKQEAEAQAEAVRGAYEEAAALEAAARSVYNQLSAEAADLLEQEQAASRAAAQQAAQNASYNVDLNNTILARAFSKLGSDATYVWGASGPDCFDCSGFVGWCYGYSSHVFTSQRLYQLPEVSDPQPGDVCVVRGHAAIYIGDGMLIECTRSVNGVRTRSAAGYKIVRPATNF